MLLLANSHNNSIMNEYLTAFARWGKLVHFPAIRDVAGCSSDAYLDRLFTASQRMPRREGIDELCGPRNARTARRVIIGGKPA